MPPNAPYVFAGFPFLFFPVYPRCDFSFSACPVCIAHSPSLIDEVVEPNCPVCLVLAPFILWF